MENTENNEYYLRLNVALEALIDRWYAWSHLVSPATAALNIKERHLKIMQSYIKNPRIHAAAVKKPEMLGGPFIDYEGGRVDEIQQLYDKTVSSRADLLELANAINELNQTLISEAKGYSMNTVYEKVPDILKGLVELYYDVNNQPNFRFFESLLYETKYYDDSTQSVAIQLIESDNSRSFVLSTPRLDNPDIIHIDLPFKENVLDRLLKCKHHPVSKGEIEKFKQELSIEEEQEGLFEEMFTTEAPEPYAPYEGNGIRTRYFGHACVLVETSEISILVDPVISYDGYETEVNRYTVNDLPEVIDYVIITHNHQDHILLETLLQLRHKTKNIIVPSCGKGNLQDPSIKLMFEQIGFDNVIELSDMESVELDKCAIRALPFLGEHSDLDVRSKACFHVSLHNRFKVIFVADSQNVEPKLYERIQKVIGDVDVIFLGMECDGAPLSWLYGPLLPNPLDREKDQSRRLAGSNFKEGIHLVETFNPKHVFVYAMGLEPWLEFISSIKYTDESRPIIESNRLVEECQKQGRFAERLFGEKTIEY